ncbi:retinol dehydrogenase 12 [Folsomia candida]|uniref:Retinol dehydrogenase 12 n=1 Tax=Folsomia candida TaxID=158441 RepID=A0A226ENR0_FOLCA|nr:retinol dehydrogenase 12 [Folsomia candida]OXA58216.1 Retinol dehydrogenase 12 [Folsomia candida]
MLCCLSGWLCSTLFYFAILPAAVLLGTKLIIKKLRGKVDPTNEVDIQGKTVIVTGASDGIGKVTAEEFAIRGARVIMACRNLQKAEKCVEDIRKKTSNGELIVMELDLSKLSSVRKFASEFLQKYGGDSNPGGLSILVNNAGIVNPLGVRKVTEDGFEETFGVNHLGHFLLTNLLLPEIEKAGNKSSDPSRIVIVSSGAHNWGQLNFDDLMFEKTPFEDFKILPKLYCNSKLANNLFNLELAKKLRAKKVNVNCYALCPGFVLTNIETDALRETPPHWLILNVIRPILKFVMLKNAKEGTETTIYCSLSKYLTHHSGEMYRNSEFWDYSKRPKLSEKDAAKLWEMSEKLVKLN